jgi:YD repeat-containing protein
VSARLTTVVHPGGGTTEICYDEHGRRSTTLAPDGTLTTYRWSDGDRLQEITQTTAEARTWRLAIERDPFGMLRHVSGDGPPHGDRQLDGVLLGERRVAIVASIAVAPPGPQRRCRHGRQALGAVCRRETFRVPP